MLIFLLPLFLFGTAQATTPNPPIVELLHPQEQESFDDLVQLRENLENVHLVGLGEANHGTSEFFLYKARLVKFLVTQGNFQVLLLESGYFSCEKLNDFVLGKPIPLKEALLAQQKTIWVTREFADLFEWLRKHNQNVPPSKRVTIMGFDARDNGIGREYLANYLKQESPNFHIQINDKLQKVALMGVEEKRVAMRGSTTLQEIENHLQSIRNRKSVREDPEKFETAWRAVQILKQASAFATSKSLPIAKKGRAYFMAENLKYFAGNNPGKKMILWAHNGHVGVGNCKFPNGVNLGTHLRNWLKEQYFAIGFSFGSGTFRARGNEEGHDFTAFPTGDPFPGSMSAEFESYGNQNYLLVIRGLEPMPENLTKPWIVRWSGDTLKSQYKKDWRDDGYWVVPADQFDAFIFVNNIKAAADYNSTKR